MTHTNQSLSLSPTLLSEGFFTISEISMMSDYLFDFCNKAKQNYFLKKKVSEANLKLQMSELPISSVTFTKSSPSVGLSSAFLWTLHFAVAW